MLGHPRAQPRTGRSCTFRRSATCTATASWLSPRCIRRTCRRRWRRARSIRPKSIANGLGYVGVLCVEFFALADGSLVVNEMAPRPHNSGHCTMEACDVSQFELQVRTLAGLPLAAPRQHSAAIMLNLLGDLWFTPRAATSRFRRAGAEVLALPGVHLHLYGKIDPRRGRKMGHLTLTGATLEAVRASRPRRPRCCWACRR